MMGNLPSRSDFKIKGAIFGCEMEFSALNSAIIDSETRYNVVLSVLAVTKEIKTSHASQSCSFLKALLSLNEPHTDALSAQFV